MTEQLKPRVGDVWRSRYGVERMIVGFVALGCVAVKYTDSGCDGKVAISGLGELVSREPQVGDWVEWGRALIGPPRQEGVVVGEYGDDSWLVSTPGFHYPRTPPKSECVFVSRPPVPETPANTQRHDFGARVRDVAGQTGSITGGVFGPGSATYSVEWDDGHTTAPDMPERLLWPSDVPEPENPSESKFKPGDLVRNSEVGCYGFIDSAMHLFPGHESVVYGYDVIERETKQRRFWCIGHLERVLTADEVAHPRTPDLAAQLATVTRERDSDIEQLSQTDTALKAACVIGTEQRREIAVLQHVLGSLACNELATGNTSAHLKRHGLDVTPGGLAEWRDSPQEAAR